MLKQRKLSNLFVIDEYIAYKETREIRKGLINAIFFYIIRISLLSSAVSFTPVFFGWESWVAKSLNSKRVFAELSMVIQTFGYMISCSFYILQCFKKNWFSKFGIKLIFFGVIYQFIWSTIQFFVVKKLGLNFLGVQFFWGTH